MLHYLPIQLSTYAPDIDGVITYIYVVCGAWFLAALGILLGFTWHSRHRPGVRAKWLPGDDRRGTAMILVPVGAVLFCDFLIEQRATPVWEKVKIDIPGEGFDVKITARQFAWVFTYPGADGKLGTADDIAANELHVPRQTPIRFSLEAADVLHAFYVPELRLKQDAVPGRAIEGWFDAIGDGTFEIGCAEICGKGHTTMRAVMVVSSREEVDAWLAQQ